MAEHRCRLGVDPRLQHPDRGRSAPEDQGADHAEDAEGEAERADQEARVAERNDEPVPPTQCLEKLSLLNSRCGQTTPLPGSFAVLVAQVRIVTRRWSGSYTSWFKAGQTG